MPTAISLDRSEAVNLNIGKTLQLTATLTPSTAQSDLEWKSSNEDAATVSQDGLITPVSEGSTVISVQTKKLDSSGKALSASVQVNITNPYKPTGISLSAQSPASLMLNETMTLTAQLEPKNAWTHLKWTNSRPTVASFDEESGRITALQNGSTTITVTTDNNLSASLELTVIDPSQPTSIEIDPSGPFELDLHDTLQLNAIFQPDTASSDVIWITSDSYTATVDRTGLVTPAHVGTVTISADAFKLSALGGFLVASVQINVVDLYKPMALSLEPSGTVNMNLDETLQLHAVLEPQDALTDLTWTSSIQSVAEVDENGEVTPLTKGETTIIATTTEPGPNGKPLSARVNISIIDPTRPTALALEPSESVEMMLGDTLPLQVKLEPDTAQTELLWTSQLDFVASVDDDGLVTALREGETNIIVKGKKASPSGQYLSDKIRVKIIDPTRPTSLTLDRTEEVDLNIDEVLQLHAQIEPDTARANLQWSSSNERAATVTEGGEVTPLAEGTTVITVKAFREGALSAQFSASVTVRVVDSSQPDPVEPELPDKPTRIRLDKSGVVGMNVDDSLQLHATLEPEGVQSALRWNSSQPDVADVDDQGFVTAFSEGMAHISVEAVEPSASGARLTACVMIKVVDPDNPSPVKPVRVSLDKTGTVTLDLYDPLKLHALLEPKNAWSDFKWSSSNKKIAKVDGAGNVTLLKEGKVTISVKTTRSNAKGKKLSAKVTLKIVDHHKPTGIHLDPSGTIEMNIDDEPLQLNATLAPETAISGIQWSSSNKKIATVDGDGNVTPVKEGKAVITAKTTKSNTKGKKLSAKVTVQVIDPYKPTRIAIDQDGPLELNIGDSLTLTATMEPDIAWSKLKWSSSSSKLVKLEADAETGECTVTGRKAGSVKISVKTRNGKTATVKIKIVDPTKATSVTLDQTEPVELPLNRTLMLVATMQPDTATSKLSWSSSNTKLATVRKATEEDMDEYVSPADCCVVKPKKKGNVKISVKTSTGKKASVTVIIVDAVDEFEAPSEAAPEVVNLLPEDAAEVMEAMESPEDEDLEIEIAPEGEG